MHEIRSLLLELKTGEKLQIEEALMCEEARVRKIPIRYVSLKKLRHRRSDSLPKPDELPVGNIPFIHAVLLQGLEKPIPPIDYYPSVLAPWLYRRVWKMPMKQLLSAYEIGQKLSPTFIKPADRVKDFTGRVVSCEQDVREIPCSKSGSIACSEPVEWVAEWRAYVIDGKIRAIHAYEPTPCVHEPNRAEMERAVETLILSGWKRRTLSIDFGLLSTGETRWWKWETAIRSELTEFPAEITLSLLRRLGEKLLLIEKT